MPKKWKVTLPNGHSFEIESDYPSRELKDWGHVKFDLEEIVEKVEVLADPRCAGTLLLTMEEAAEELRVSSRFVYTLSHRADFPTVMLGRRRMISRAGLIEWVKKQEQNREVS